jgi:phosphoribosylaminoimidazole-succinocarboxamide synthase
MQSFVFPNQSSFYKGKVRDVYTIDDRLLAMVASDRISAFDVILPRAIPFKGQVLNQIASYMLKSTSDICPNWLLDVPAPNVSVGIKCEPFKVEMVVRGNLTGHSWRTYSSGNKMLCGVRMADGLSENDFFPTPIITPSTKAAEGHDEDISKEEIIERKIVSKEDYEIMESYALQLFARGKELALKRNLILADTKYEFILLIAPGIFTPGVLMAGNPAVKSKSNSAKNLLENGLSKIILWGKQAKKYLK